ncbi:MAG: WD40 repeat domain-containing protein, partial [Pirellulaceae bacterium]|nr:WD40 repeat domain-containing protein [Pirellulaceae bacterium]
MLEERNRFRTERDRAEANLYDALVGDTKAQLVGREGDFWFKARDNLQQAAKLTVAQRDQTTLRNLAIHWMGSEYPCLTRTVLHTHASKVADVSLTRDSSLLSSCTPDGDVVLADTSEGKRVASLSFPAGVTRAKLSPDGKQLLVATTDSRLIRVRGPFTSESDSTAARQDVISLAGYGVTQIRFHDPTGAVIFGCTDGRVRTAPQDFSAASQLQPLPDRVGVVTDLALTRDADRLVAVGEDRRMAVWDLASRELLRLIELTRTPTCVTFCARNGNLAWSDTERFGVFFESVAADQVLSRLAIRNLHSQSILHLHEMPGGEILTASSDGTIALLDPIRIRNVGRASERAGRVLSLEVSHDGRRIATGYESGKVVLWQVNYSPFVAQHISYYWSFFAADRLAVSRQQYAAVLTPVNSPAAFAPEIESSDGEVDAWEFRSLPSGKEFVR